MATVERLAGCYLGFCTDKLAVDNAEKAIMATVGELKVNIVACGGPELAHLLAMLEANIENLPAIVVKAMQALADSLPVEDANVEA